MKPISDRQEKQLNRLFVILTLIIILALITQNLYNS